MTDEQKDAIAGQVKVLLGGLGGFVIGKGWVSADIVNAIIGLGMLLFPLAWAWWANKKAEAKTQERETIAVQAGIQRAQERPVVDPVVLKSDAQEIIKNYGPVDQAAAK